MVITEIELRELWRDGRHPLPAFPPGTRFSPAAQDFIKDHRLEIRFADPSPSSPAPQLQIANYQPRSSLPQLPITNYPLPFVLDTLHALAQLVAAEARRYQLPALGQRLDGLASDCLALRGAEQAGRDPAPLATPAPAGAPPEFAPGPADHAILHWLNLLRARARQAAALAAGAAPARPRLAAALEQISLAAADLGRRVQSGELGWKAPMV